jgi:hypothetical protein
MRAPADRRQRLHATASITRVAMLNRSRFAPSHRIDPLETATFGSRSILGRW